MKSGYMSKFTPFADNIRCRDIKLWGKISADKKHCLYDLLPKQRNRMLQDRGRNYILPGVNTERYKNTFVNRCLFELV